MTGHRLRGFCQAWDGAFGNVMVRYRTTPSEALAMANAFSKGATVGRGYPPPPWRLHGWAIQTLHAIPLEAARRYVPQGLPIIPILPGHTLATLVFASYESGSLAYHELLLGIGLVWLRGPRFCIPRIWVDSAASVAGGREIWKLPKEPARFDLRRSGDSITIEAADICRIDARASRHTVPLWFPALAFGEDAAGTMFPFSAYMRARTSLARVTISPLSDTFASMQLSRPFVGVRYESLDVLVHGPSAASAVRSPFAGRGQLR
jgi:Acetoacetate decarboxylase (ADC)